MADVEINYEGNTIASMSASGTKTLLTAGKYCDDDIEVVYTSPGGGGVNLVKHSGTFTPANNTTRWSVTGLGAPMIFLQFTCAANSLDGTSKMVGGLYVDGSWATTRTNAGGTARAASEYMPYNVASFPGRTVYTDDDFPSTGETIRATTTGFLVQAPSATYNFKAGYSYTWECWTLPES